MQECSPNISGIFLLPITASGRMRVDTSLRRVGIVIWNKNKS